MHKCVQDKKESNVTQKRFFFVKQMTIIYISNKKKNVNVFLTHTLEDKKKKNRKIGLFFSLPRTKKNENLFHETSKKKDKECLV